MESKSEVNMVAQPGIRTAAVALGGQPDTKEHTVASSSAMDADAPVVHPDMSDVNVFSMSSDSGGSKVGSPFNSPTPPGLPSAKSTRKRASSQPQPGRRPDDLDESGVPLPPRLVHRRAPAAADPGADTYPAQQHGKIKQLEEQVEADREVISQMHIAVNDLYGYVREHGISIKKLQQRNAVQNTNILGVESGVLKKVEENKSFLASSFQLKLDEAQRETLKRVEHELQNKATMSGFMVGRGDDPVLRPLVDTLLKAKMDDIDSKFVILQQFMDTRQERESKVEEYLMSLKEQRPEEGKIIMKAFDNLAIDLVEIRANALQAGNGTPSAPPQSGAQQTSAPGADNGVSKDSTDGANKIEKEILEIQKELIRINRDVMQGKCHCVHLDALDNRVTAVNAKVDVHTKALTILEKSVEMIRTTSSPGTGSGTASKGPDPWHAYPHTAGAPGGAGGSGGAGGGGTGAHDAWYLLQENGGNGVCHCVHVDQLRAELDVLKLTVDEMNDGSFDHFGDGTVGAGYGGGRKPRKPAQPLPLVVGALGQLHDVNAKLFDDRQASQPGYQFDGSKGGVAWKGKLENYFISKCPGMMEVL